eukprot:4608720-Pleurochrysis_carterae.AAC.2
MKPSADACRVFSDLAAPVAAARERHVHRLSRGAPPPADGGVLRGRCGRVHRRGGVSHGVGRPLARQARRQRRQALAQAPLAGAGAAIVCCAPPPSSIPACFLVTSLISALPFYYLPLSCPTTALPPSF